MDFGCYLETIHFLIRKITPIVTIFVGVAYVRSVVRGALFEGSRQQIPNATSTLDEINLAQIQPVKGGLVELSQVLHLIDAYKACEIDPSKWNTQRRQN